MLSVDRSGKARRNWALKNLDLGARTGQLTYGLPASAKEPINIVIGLVALASK